MVNDAPNNVPYMAVEHTPRRPYVNLLLIVGSVSPFLLGVAVTGWLAVSVRIMGDPISIAELVVAVLSTIFGGGGLGVGLWGMRAQRDELFLQAAKELSADSVEGRYAAVLALQQMLRWRGQREQAVRTLCMFLRRRGFDSQEPDLKLALEAISRRPSSCPGTWVDLGDTDLSGATLVDANFMMADLHRAVLGGATLIAANLSRAGLRDADLSRAVLSGADLSRAVLHFADLSGANLRGANLSGADLRRAYLSEANLRGANLSGANLTGAKLNGTDLSGADLSNSDLESSVLSGTVGLTYAQAVTASTFPPESLRLLAETGSGEARVAGSARVGAIEKIDPDTRAELRRALDG